MRRRKIFSIKLLHFIFIEHALGVVRKVSNNLTFSYHMYGKESNALETESLQVWSSEPKIRFLAVNLCVSAKSSIQRQITAGKPSLEFWIHFLMGCKRKIKNSST